MNEQEAFEAPRKFLALGDSYTIGESVDESERWPVLLVDSLNKMGVEILPAKIIATTGWTTDELKAGIVDQEPIAKDYDLVSLLIGVNNQFRGRSVDQFETEFKDLLDQSIVYAGGDANKVFVVSIPDYGVTPFAQDRDPKKIGKGIDAYNKVCRNEAESRGITYFDITPISRNAKTSPTLVAADGLHPSGIMYKEWVGLMIADLSAKLSK